jgi:E3 ubiquitin-protein ligase SHPRH
MVYATQIMQHDVGFDQRPQKCLEILLQAEREADEVIADVLSAITDHGGEGVELKAEVASLHAKRGKKQAFGDNEVHDFEGTEGIRRDGPLDDSFSTFDGERDNELDDSGLPKTPAGDEHLHKSRALQQRLRDCYLTLHKVKFIQGDMYHWMGEAKAVQEMLAYKAAEGIRKKLLKCMFLSYSSDAE